MPISYVETHGRQTRVFVEGDEEAPPVVFVHGIGRSLEDWEPQFAHYRRAGYRVIALDLPGSGFSDRLLCATTLTRLARGVAETLDAIGETRPVHVVGNSLGGAVAMQLLTLQPDRVATLVLTNSAGFGSGLHPVIRLLSPRFVGSRVARHTTRASARMVERLLFVDQSLVTEERLDRAIRIARQPDTAAVKHETARSLVSLGGVRRGWRDKLLANVSHHPRPTLIVWGDADRILPAKQLDFAQRSLPHAQAHLFPDVGHMPQIEVADEFAQRSLGFLHSYARVNR